MQAALGVLHNLCVTQSGLEAVGQWRSGSHAAAASTPGDVGGGERATEGPTGGPDAGAAELAIKAMMLHEGGEELLERGCAMLFRLAHGHRAALDRVRAEPATAGLLLRLRGRAPAAGWEAGPDFCALLVHTLG